MATLNQLIESGRNEAKESRYEAAIDYLKQAIDKDPKSADAHFYLAGVFYKKEDLEAALREVKAALRCDPMHDKAIILLNRLQPDENSSGPGESTLPRISGIAVFIVILILLGVIYATLFFQIELLSREYGRILGNIYHSMDVDDPITENWQPWRLATGGMVVLVVLVTLFIPSLIISYGISCPIYAIRHNRWRFDLGLSSELGAGAGVLAIGLIMPFFVLMVLILIKLWGIKVLFLLGILVLLGIYQLFELSDQKKQVQKSLE